MSGRRPGETFPGGDVLSRASGAAFMTVVAAQCANAFACRSSSQWAGGGAAPPPARLLPPAVLAGLSISLATLLTGPIARRLGQAPPPAAAWAFIVSAPVVVVAVDAVEKQLARRRVAREAHGLGARTAG